MSPKSNLCQFSKSIAEYQLKQIANVFMCFSDNTSTPPRDWMTRKNEEYFREDGCVYQEVFTIHTYVLNTHRYIYIYINIYKYILSGAHP